ncbi:hypothetical protein ACFYM0_32995 [Streptomyces sp. NPDC006487]|uniref:hypothetical protein n=1 Tax=Streptomyces sp. NPDC006487 TaxID=3364748 RepID=UPI0036968616
MNANRLGLLTGATDGPVVERLLTRNHAAHARTVLNYVQAQAPYPEPDVHLLVHLLTLRAARDGTGHITGQDITSWLPHGGEQVLEQLVAAGWLLPPGSPAEALASRPEACATFTVPGLLPEQTRPFSFGKTTPAKSPAALRKRSATGSCARRGWAPQPGSWPCTPPPTPKATATSGTPRRRARPG